MRKLSVFVALATLAGVAHAEGLRATANKMCSSVCGCIMKKDAAGFETVTRAVSAPDFKCIEMGKTMSYDEMLADMKTNFAMFKKVTSAKAKVTKATEKGSDGNVKITHRVAGIMIGPDKKTHKFTMDGKSDDTWKKDGKTWKMVQMNWKSQKFTLDGKPFDPSKAPG